MRRNIGEYDERTWEALQRLEAMLVEQRKLLVGNGEVGLCEQVRLNTASIVKLTTMVAKRWTWSLILFGVGAATWLWHTAGGDPTKLPGFVLHWLGG